MKKKAEEFKLYDRVVLKKKVHVVTAICTDGIFICPEDIGEFHINTSFHIKEERFHLLSEPAKKRSK